ncbi:hypothetical protein GQ53DRAFT_39691 [Thozetella sp. PMI_491]|nr:hypothetical protein GQ53DRAFT_39691 [Thozetella sp. PMI_491]
MSAPPDGHGRSTQTPTPTPTTPRPALHERSQSQNNKLAIRIVPYTPPRLVSGERPPSQVSSHSRYADESSAGNYDSYRDHESTSLAGPSQPSFADRKKGNASSRGSALSSDSTLSLRLVSAQDEGVSGTKQAPERQGSGAQPTPLSPTRTRPVLSTPSEVGLGNITSVNASFSPQHLSPAPPQANFPQPGASASADASTSQNTAGHLSRRRNFVTVHADKTFTLIQLRPTSTARSDVSGSIRSPPLSSSLPSYSSRTSSSHERPSIDAWSDYRTSSPPLTGTSATIPDHSLSELSPLAPSPSSSAQLAEDPITSSPWNYHLVGGLRKVPKTPDVKEKQPLYNTSQTTTAATPLTSSPADTLAPLPEITVYRDQDATPSRTVEPKASFSSVLTVSTTSETSNYKVYGHSPGLESSESLALLSTSSHPNYEILGESSPAPPFESSPPGSSDSNANYILHGDPSPSSLAATRKQPRPSYSQESLKVPPLILGPSRTRSNERLGYYKQRSRESLRARAGSIKSIKSISSIIQTQDVTQVFAANPIFTGLQGQPVPRGGGGDGGDSFRSNFAPPSDTRSPWSSGRLAGGSSTTGSSSAHPLPPVPMTESHPHVWSSQLSTVMSESEGSTRAPSRSVSPSTGHGVPIHRRRSSAGWASSMHSRQLHSISSSLAAQLEEAASGSASQSDSLERPRPTFSRGGPSGPRTVRDQDEHGDGITDLYETSNQASRSGLSGFFSSSNSSSRNLHSSASAISRANSFVSSSIPAWARVYYGSGERRLLRVASVSTLSDSGAGGDSRPGSSAFRSSNSPNTDHFPLSIYSPRKRAKEVNPPRGQRPFSDSASMDIAPASRGLDYGVVRTLKHKTSSIWSPHLRVDRRATARYSIWEPPSVNWSADSGMLGKRNAQVVLFAVGFIFPFAWMIAAVLRLPPNPKLEMLERRDMSQTHFGSGQINFSQRTAVVDQSRYESARWWRNVNRFMSVVGLLIIGAIVALVIIGIRQGWVMKTG